MDSRRTQATETGYMDKRVSTYLRSGRRWVQGPTPPSAMRMAVAVAQAQDDASIHGNVAEIGVQHGSFFILLYLLSRAPEKGVAVDLFSMQQLNVDNSGYGDLARFLRNMKRHTDAERLVTHETNSMWLTSEALIALAGGPYRLISVDGGHTPEITMHDLAVAEGALAEGGVVILDDCFNEMWPGVVDGVHRFLSTPRSILPFAIGGNKTLFCHPKFAERYAAALGTVAPRTFNREFMGAKVLCLDFALPLRDRLAHSPAWKAIKNYPPFRIARRIYWAMQ
jgi:hypothetical protein